VGKLKRIPENRKLYEPQIDSLGTLYAVQQYTESFSGSSK
jgi:hypothetical protein